VSAKEWLTLGAKEEPEVPEPAAPEEEDGIQVSNVLARALQLVPIPVFPFANNSDWQLVNMPDGTVAAVLSITNGNGVALYWFGPKDMESFINNTVGAFKTLAQMNAVRNPLVVADQQQMQAAIQNSSRNLSSPART
jgi:hypothetical protein